MTMQREQCAVECAPSSSNETSPVNRAYHMSEKLIDEALEESEAVMLELSKDKRKLTNHGDHRTVEPTCIDSIARMSRRLESNENAAILPLNRTDSHQTKLIGPIYPSLSKAVDGKDIIDVLCFSMDTNDPLLRTTDIVYTSADRKSLLLIRKYPIRLRNRIAKASPKTAIPSHSISHSPRKVEQDGKESPSSESDSTEGNKQSAPYGRTELYGQQAPIVRRRRSCVDAGPNTARPYEKRVASLPLTPRRVLMKGLLNPNVKVTKIWVNGRPTTVR